MNSEQSKMSEGVTLRFKVTLEDASNLCIYQIGKEYAVCILDEHEIKSMKFFSSASGVRKHMKVKYGIGVKIDD